jgi:hypothetical protein
MISDRTMLGNGRGLSVGQHAAWFYFWKLFVPDKYLAGAIVYRRKGYENALLRAKA